MFTGMVSCTPTINDLCAIDYTYTEHPFPDTFVVLARGIQNLFFEVR
jgi:hypothetical protein